MLCRDVLTDRSSELNSEVFSHLKKAPEDIHSRSTAPGVGDGILKTYQPSQQEQIIAEKLILYLLLRKISLLTYSSLPDFACSTAETGLTQISFIKLHLLYKKPTEYAGPLPPQRRDEPWKTSSQFHLDNHMKPRTTDITSILAYAYRQVAVFLLKVRDFRDNYPCRGHLSDHPNNYLHLRNLLEVDKLKTPE